MVEIIWKKQALKDLEKLEVIVGKRVISAIEDLTEDLFTHDVKPLRSSRLFRLRVGDYRVILALEGNIIIIVMVGHSKNIYQRLELI